MRNLSYSTTGLALTKTFEGLRLSAYTDSAGIWTIGYGHTGKDVKAGDYITEANATEALIADLQDAVRCVNEAVRQEVTLSQNQFDALVDFCFNVGRHSFETSRLLQAVNAGDTAAAVREFEAWIHVQGNPVPGLVRRRHAEATLFTRNQQT